MLQSGGYYCDWCKKPILLQKTIDHICLPCCSHIMHYHDKNEDCKKNVLRKADIHTDILSALQHGQISQKIAQETMLKNLLTFKI